LSLYDKPSNKFVAGFIGSPPMNFVDVEIIKKGEDIFLNEGMFELKAPKQFKEALAPYALKKMTLGVRPEDIYDKLFYTMGPKDGNGLSATIEVVEPLGSEIFLHFNTGKNTLVAKVDAHNQAKTNQVIELVINMNKVHLYDTRTGISVV
jgi:multiple sugar transport system ATP-binding protein